MRKVIFLLLVTASLVSAINTYSQGPPPGPSKVGQEQQNKTSPKKEKSDNHDGIPDKISSAIKIAPTQSTNTEKKSDSKNSNDTATDNWSLSNILLIGFNGLLAIFTFCLWRSTDKMWKSTKEAADAAQKSADALQSAERAHLFIDSVEWMIWEPYFSISEYNQSTVVINIINVGRTPAILIDAGVTIDIKKSGYPTKDDIDRIGIPNFPKGVIIKPLEIYPMDCREIIGPSVISEADFMKSKIFCYGFVRYNDVFHNSHPIRFCYEFRPTPTQSRKLFYISPNKELNDYT